MKQLLIATTNPGKFKEIAAILSELDVELLSLADLGIGLDFDETGKTFEENALGKARFYAGLSGLPTVADDSGIFVDALADELGLKTRRWGAGHEASDEEWLDFFMNRMSGEQERGARFICVAALVAGDELVFEHEVCGVITEALEAPIAAGIPLSSVFKVEGCDKVYSALEPAEKNRLSHRGNAFRKLLNHLKND